MRHITVRRVLGVFFGTVGAVLLFGVLYLSFADLGRHKGRIEALVTRSLGRPFAIDGPFRLKLIPVIDVSAERVRLGNVPGGSQPQMVEFGKAVVQIGFWSLISGQPDVHLFELQDATVLLERGPEGNGNWVFGAVDEEAVDEIDEPASAAEVPVIIRGAQLSNVRVIYREARKSDRVFWFDELGITPGREEMLALTGSGKLDAYPVTLSGELGTLKSLLSARDIRLGLQMSLGSLALDVKGVIGSLTPLDGVDLALEIENPEFGAMLAKLDLPPIANGAMRIDGRLEDAGELTRLTFKAKAGDLTVSAKGTIRQLSLAGADLTLEVGHEEIGAMLEALALPVIATGPMRFDTRIKDAGARKQVDFSVKLGDLEGKGKGTLKTLSLVGSDLEFEATAADAARLAQAFDVGGVPAAPLTVTGHAVHSRKQTNFESLTANIAGASVRVAGTVVHMRDRAASLQFEMATESLATLRQAWPDLEVSATGALEVAKDRLEAKNLQVAIGENQLAGSVLLAGDKHIEAQLTSPRLDLTPYLAKDQPEGASSQTTPKKKFLFSEAPLSFYKVTDTEAKLHLVCNELVLGERSFKDLDTHVHLDHGKLTFDARAAGVHDGTLSGAGTLQPVGDGSADLEFKLGLSGVRASLGAQDIARSDVPPVGLELDIRTHGSSLRQMASGANGHVLLTQGAGKTRSGFIGAYGGDVVRQLGEKLNPFARADPYMRLECTVARARIVDGEVVVKPLVIQTEKVTITAHGNIDLRTEKLLFDFSTRPRKGIGVSPGMFTNPLIRLEGTLLNPKIGVGAKGLASGAIAAVTGGVTVVAGGLVDRMAGEQDICRKTLAAATTPAEP